MTLQAATKSLSDCSFRPALNYAFIGRLILFKSHFLFVKERIRLNEHPLWLVLREHNFPPLEIFAIYPGEFLVIRATCLDIRCASVHVQFQEHSTQRRFPLSDDLEPVDANDESLLRRIAFDSHESPTVGQKTLESRKMSLCGRVSIPRPSCKPKLLDDGLCYVLVPISIPMNY